MLPGRKRSKSKRRLKKATKSSRQMKANPKSRRPLDRLEQEVEKNK